MRVRVSLLRRKSKAESPEAPEVNVQEKAVPPVAVLAARAVPAVGVSANIAFKPA